MNEVGTGAGVVGAVFVGAVAASVVASAGAGVGLGAGVVCPSELGVRSPSSLACTEMSVAEGVFCGVCCCVSVAVRTFWSAAGVVGSGSVGCCAVRSGLPGVVCSSGCSLVGGLVVGGTAGWGVVSVEASRLLGAADCGGSCVALPSPGTGMSLLVGGVAVADGSRTGGVEAVCSGAPTAGRVVWSVVGVVTGRVGVAAGVVGAAVSGVFVSSVPGVPGRVGEVSVMAGVAVVVAPLASGSPGSTPVTGPEMGDVKATIGASAPVRGAAPMLIIGSSIPGVPGKSAATPPVTVDVFWVCWVLLGACCSGLCSGAVGACAVTGWVERTLLGCSAAFCCGDVWMWPVSVSEFLTPSGEEVRFWASRETRRGVSVALRSASPKVRSWESRAAIPARDDLRKRVRAASAAFTDEISRRLIRLCFP
ncbi:Uncharacterised protein [Dermatophilus congolensis]|uniref:Uncharacterized protein n=1 Tax=Dermatophilus congolensis TaxID=1863 RepID=A0A239VV85_9MICO|nr:Uncharacterised protein [Dermatophilus congolensis]